MKCPYRAMDAREQEQFDEYVKENGYEFFTGFARFVLAWRKWRQNAKKTTDT